VARQVHGYADEVVNAALDAARVPAAATSDPPTYSVTVTHDGKVFIATPAEYQTAWTRGATVAELRARLGEILALWTQAPCSADQIKFERDKAARAADPSDGSVETAAIP
jgi:predicted RNase H-like HicB family nuclease